MSDIANLYIRVDSKGVVTASKDLASFEGVAQKTEGTTKKVESATQSANSQFEKMSTIVKAVAASYAVLKMVQYIQDATMLAARYETLGVVMRVVGNNSGYTGQQMEAFAKGLEKTGISMVAARETIVKMTQAHLDLTKSEQLARVAQDAAVIGNINSSEAFQRMIYGIQSGQIEVLRTIGINVNFEKSYQDVAKATGRVAAQLTEAEKTQIRMNVVMDAGKTIAGTYEAAMGTAGKQVLSLERHLDNLKVMFGQAFTPALAEIIGVITDAVTGLNGELSGEGKEAIAVWGTNFRIGIISVEAEFMRLAMLIDKVGGTMTSAKMLLYAPGSALGIESSKKRFEAAAQANIDYENRYKNTESELEKLALKQIALEQSLTKEGMAAAKAAEDSAEKKRMAAAAVGEAATESAKKQTAAEKSIIEAIRKAQAEVDAIGQTQYEKDMLRIDSEEQKWRDSKVSEVQIAQWKGLELQKVEQKSLEENAKAAKEYQKQMDEKEKSIVKGARETAAEVAKINADKLKAERDLYKDLRGYEGEFYEVSKKLINEQAKRYKDLKIDQNVIDKWQAEEYRKAEIKKLESSGIFFDGVTAGYLKMEKDALTFAKAGKKIFESFAKDSRSTMSNVFFDAFKGNLKSAKEYFTSFTDSMAKTFFDVLSQMIVEASIKEIVMHFGATWTAGADAVLGVVGKVLGYATDWLLGGSSSGDSLNLGNSTSTISGNSTGTYFTPEYAEGGQHPGGWRIVGENGPELEYTGASQIFNNGNTNKILAAIASQGQHGDTMLAHINPAEAALLKTLGGAGSINERTGLPQFYTDWSIYRRPDFSNDSIDAIANTWVDLNNSTVNTATDILAARNALLTPAFKAERKAYAEAQKQKDFYLRDTRPWSKGGMFIGWQGGVPVFSNSIYTPVGGVYYSYNGDGSLSLAEGGTSGWGLNDWMGVGITAVSAAMAAAGAAYAAPLIYSAATAGTTAAGSSMAGGTMAASEMAAASNIAAGSAYSSAAAGAASGAVGSLESSTRSGSAWPLIMGTVGGAIGGHLLGNGKVSLYDSVKSSLLSTAKKYAISEILSSIVGGQQAGYNVTFNGISGGEGLGKSIAAMPETVGGQYSFSAANGGVFSGPDSGYDGTMHGTEAVVPLPNGKSIPVAMNNQELLAEIKGLRADIRAGNLAEVKNTGKIAKILDLITGGSIDADGYPAMRVVTA